ncbi:MAG: FG-GAP repeat domain-containing protein, partial [Verrucomicrobiota bacterium]
WPNGRLTVVDGVQANHLYEIEEASAIASPPAAADPRATGTPAGTGPAAPVPGGAPWFAEAAGAWAHRHGEDADDDLAQEPLAIRRYGWLGPGLALADVDGDGLTDAVAGASRGEKVRWYRGDGRGGLAEAGALDNPFPADTAGPLVVRTAADATWLVLGSLEAGEGAGSRVAAYRWRDGQWVAGPVLGPEPGEWAVAPGRTLAAADVDGDGRVEFFLGGLRRAGLGEGRGQSCLWNLSATGWVRGRAVEVGYSAAGRVQAAVLADLDGDGTVELATAGEWGAVTVASTGPGSRARAVPARRGWWQSLAVADFDGDGQLDLVAGNWGLNSRWAIWGDGRPRAFLGDFEGNGVPLVLEAWAAAGDAGWRPWRDLETLAAAWPSVRARFPSHAAFARATAEEVLGPARARALGVATDTLASHLFLRRGEGYQPEALPAPAQWAPVFGLAVADFDGDGREDLFLGQNDSG